MLRCREAYVDYISPGTGEADGHSASPPGAERPRTGTLRPAAGCVPDYSGVILVRGSLCVGGFARACRTAAAVGVFAAPSGSLSSVVRRLSPVRHTFAISDRTISSHSSPWARVAGTAGCRRPDVRPALGADEPRYARQGQRGGDVEVQAESQEVLGVI